MNKQRLQVYLNDELVAKVKEYQEIYNQPSVTRALELIIDSFFNSTQPTQLTQVESSSLTQSPSIDNQALKTLQESIVQLEERVTQGEERQKQLAEEVKNLKRSQRNKFSYTKEVEYKAIKDWFEKATAFCDLNHNPPMYLTDLVRSYELYREVEKPIDTIPPSRVYWAIMNFLKRQGYKEKGLIDIQKKGKELLVYGLMEIVLESKLDQ